MARFDLLSDLSVPPPLPLNASARMNGCDLSARLTDLQGETVKQIDDVLEDTRLMIPHVPLLRTVLGQQAQRYNSGRLLLIALLLYIATSGADPSHPLVSSNSASLKPIIDDVRLWIQREALNCVLFSPVKSRELVIAIELLAVYDPLLSQGPLHHLETPSFILPTSFYLDAAIGRASRSHIEASIKSLQDWYVQDMAQSSSSASSASSTAPLPDHIIEALMDASMWVSLEVTSGEVNRNVKGMTNCFAKDYVSMWPGASDSSPTTSTHLSSSASSPPPSFSTITTHILPRLPPSTVSLGARLGLVNLAFRHSGLFLIQETLRELYDGIPDVAKMDRLYTSMEEGLTKRCREFADVCKERVVNAATSTSSTATTTTTTTSTTKKRSDSSAGAGGKDDTSAASALLRSALIDLANDTLEREATWMRHFYGGYCFAILLWLPQLRKAPAQAAKRRKGGVAGSGLGAIGSGASGSGTGAGAAAAAKGGEGSPASAANPSMAGIATAAAGGGAATGGEDEGSATPVEVAPRFHEHGVHDSDIAKSVIDVIRDRNTNPDTIMADAASASSPSAATAAAGGAAAGPSSSGGAGEGVPAGVASRAGAHLNPTTSSTPTSTSSSASMSPFDFLVKHTPAHEAGVIHLLTLTLATHSRSRSSDPRRAVTNSRLLYACKEIIENHATRRRGWGKVGEEALMHVGLLRRVCEAFAKKGGKDGKGAGSGGNVLDLSLAKLVRVLERVLDGWRRTPLGGQQGAQGGQAAAATATQGKGGAQRGGGAAAAAGGEQQSRAQQRHAQQETGAQSRGGGGQPGPQSGSPAYPSHLMPSSADLQRQLAYGAANAQQPQRSPYYPGGPGGPSPPRLYAQQYSSEQYGQPPPPGHMPRPPPPPHYYGQHPHESQPQQQYPSAGMPYQQQQGGPGGPRGSMSAHPAYGEAGPYGQQHQHQGYGSPMGYRGNEPGNGNGNGYGPAQGYPQPPFGSAQMQQGYGQHPQQQQQQQQQQHQQGGGGSEAFPSSSSPLAPLSLLDLDLLSDRNLDAFNNSTNSTSSTTFPNIGSGSAPGSDSGGGVGNHSADASLSSLVDFDVDNLWQSFGGPSTTLSVGMMMEDFMGGGAAGGSQGGSFAQMAQQQGGAGGGGAGGFEGLVSGSGNGDFSQFMSAATGGSGQTPQQQQQGQQQQQAFSGAGQGQGNGGGGGWPQHQPAAPLSAGLGDFDWATMSELFQP